MILFVYNSSLKLGSVLVTFDIIYSVVKVTNMSPSLRELICKANLYI